METWQFVTYADNYAIGYFKKQGFQKAPPGGDPRWQGYIKASELCPFVVLVAFGFIT